MHRAVFSRLVRGENFGGLFLLLSGSDCSLLDCSAKMDWRTLFLAATLQNVLSLPMDICCPESNPPLSGLSLLEKPVPVISSSLEFYFNQIKHNEGLSNDITEYREEDCCTNVLTREELKQPSKDTRPEVGLNLQRTKRFPIHLDPLYQYRYLARSGRKSHVCILF